MTISQQLSIGFGSAAREQQRLPWFGLSLDYRTLFDGLSEDWLPTLGAAGYLLGVSSFATLPDRDNARVLETYVVFDPDLFPPLDIFVWRSGAWITGKTVDVLPTDEAVFWPGDLSRRVQHYGWRYDYKARSVTEEMRLGPLPDWAQRLAKRLHSEGLVPHVPDQVIVNEYVRKQGISEHVDCVPCFADGIATISLLESWEMVFRRGDDTKRLLLEANSVAVLTGDARYEWTHEIPQRVTERSGLRRQRRISVTFRKVLLPSS